MNKKFQFSGSETVTVVGFLYWVAVKMKEEGKEVSLQEKQLKSLEVE